MAIYSSIYDGPPRGFSYTSERKRYIAIHNTSNDASAENEASYAKRRTDGVSSHYYVDSNSIIQSLDTKHKAWHAGSGMGNTYGIAYEITGTNSKSRQWYLDNVAWDLLAKQIATDMKLWNISNKHLTISQMNDGRSTGIVTHDDMRRAWGGTTHTDPGGNFPLDHLINKVNQYLTGDEDMAYDTQAENRDIATTTRALAILEGRPTAEFWINGVKRVEVNKVAEQFIQLQEKTDALNTALQGLSLKLDNLTTTGTPGLSLADIKEVVKEALREGTD